MYKAIEHADDMALRFKCRAETFTTIMKDWMNDYQLTQFEEFKNIPETPKFKKHWNEIKKLKRNYRAYSRRAKFQLIQGGKIL